MNRYRAEILGNVPNGLTHNDVFASALSIIREYDSDAFITKRRLSGNRMSLIITFKADGVVKARAALSKVQYGINGFSADVFGFRDLGGK